MRDKNTYKEITLVLHVTKKSTNQGCHVDHVSWLEFLEYSSRLLSVPVISLRIYHSSVAAQFNHGKNKTYI